MYVNAITMYGIFFIFFSILLIITVPVLIAYVILWIYQIKKNSEIQVKQNKEIIQMLKRDWNYCWDIRQKNAQNFSNGFRFGRKYIHIIQQQIVNINSKKKAKLCVF